MENKKLKIDWVNSSFLILVPILTIIFVVWHLATHRFYPFHFLTFLVFYFAAGLSITAGYHRLFSHRTYVANPILEFLFLFFGAGAFQNSALKWCSDHRIHHTHADSGRDPYNIGRGFWYAHIGWILLDEKDLQLTSYPKDLEMARMVSWQHRYYFPLALFSGLILPGIFCALFFADFWGGVLWGGLLRIVFVHHATFFINSLSHLWGSRPYSEKESARDNYFLTLITYGEGYHNFHHVFPSDYRNGVKWYHFDPTKWLIYLSSLIGLAKSLKWTSEKEIWKARLGTQYRLVKKQGIPLSIDRRLIELREKIELKLAQIQSWKKELKERRSEKANEWAEEVKLKLLTAQEELQNYISQWENYLSF